MKDSIVDCSKMSRWNNRHDWPRAILIIHVDTPAQKLISRVRRRIDHSSMIPFGRGDQIVKGLAKESESLLRKKRITKLLRVCTSHTIARRYGNHDRHFKISVLMVHELQNLEHSFPTQKQHELHCYTLALCLGWRVHNRRLPKNLRHHQRTIIRREELSSSSSSRVVGVRMGRRQLLPSLRARI